MKLYEVVFWGSHGPHPNKDTIYLVRALDFRFAVETVRINASRSDHSGERLPNPDIVYELGKDCSHSHEEGARILRGPYIESAYNYSWRAWRRVTDNEAGEVDWKEEPS